MRSKSPLCLALWLVPAALPASPPPRLEILPLAGGQVQLTAFDRSNHSWVLQKSEDLINWSASGNSLHVRTSVLPLSSQSMANVPSKFYYRLASLPSTPPNTFAETLSLGQTPYGYSLAATPPANLKGIGVATINDAKATLGRVLFYDRRLSLDNSVSCASCHQQEHAFADGAAFSLGHRGVPTGRNSVSLQHVRSYLKGGMIFWDGRGKSLDSAVIEPIIHPEEMGLSLTELSRKIADEPYYQSLSASAYGTATLTTQQVGECLGDFIESMVSFRSKYDQGSVVSFTNFTAQESAGKSLFSSRCASCHPFGSFANGAFANNGLELVYQDRGRAGLTNVASDEGKFRTPSLRQVALTAPYMHDGRFATLREVIDFYDHGVVHHPNLTSPLNATPMKFTEADKLALESFLNTLTDTSILANPEFSDPFRVN